MFKRKKLNKHLILAAAIDFLKGEGFLEREIQAAWARYDRPGLIHGPKENEVYYPDIQVNKNGKPMVFDIDTLGIGKIKKWKAIYNYLNRVGGELFIIAPQKRFSKLSKLLKRNNIEAEIIDIV